MNNYIPSFGDFVNEASRFKGKEIFPDWVAPRDIAGAIRKSKNLTQGANYVIFEPGMNVWQAEWEYQGVKAGKHVFVSSVQFSDTEPLEFTGPEMENAINNAEVFLMKESVNEASVGKVADTKYGDVRSEIQSEIFGSLNIETKVVPTQTKDYEIIEGSVTVIVRIGGKGSIADTIKEYTIESKEAAEMSKVFAKRDKENDYKIEVPGLDDLQKSVHTFELKMFMKNLNLLESKYSKEQYK
jgi:hypothetical protein